MARWDINDPDRTHSAAVEVPREGRPKILESESPSVARTGTTSEGSQQRARGAREVRPRTDQPRERRTIHEFLGQTYSLRDSEFEAMADIGRFRAVDLQDLAQFVYPNDEARMKSDLDNLRGHGLIAEKTNFRAHKPARKMVTLTEKGNRVARDWPGLPAAQRIYHGFVKPREIEHDADLYKVYQKAVKDIEDRGGKPIRVRLDFELKESLNRAKHAAQNLPEGMRQRWLAAVAEEHGLRTDGRTIHLPDIQVEYQTRDGRLERENLELVSRNYREHGIRSKAAAGFRIYARATDTSRIRRALRDTGLVREVFAI